MKRNLWLIMVTCLAYCLDRELWKAIDLVIRFKQENPRSGYPRIRDYLAYLGHKIGETTVKNILIEKGYDPEPVVSTSTPRNPSGYIPMNFCTLHHLIRGGSPSGRKTDRPWT